MVGVGRGELTDKAWAAIEPLLPAGGGRGQPWRDHRQVINGILWKLRTGAPWRDLPERYGAWQHRLRPLRALAAGRHLGPAAGPRPDQVGRRRARSCGRSASTAPRSGRTSTPPGRAKTGAEPRAAAHAQDEALGRSRGGLTTKLHLACDGKGRPLAVVLTAGSATTAPSWSRCSTPSGCRGRAGGAGPASGPIASSATRATATSAAGGCCAAAASRTSSPSGTTSGRGARKRPAASRPSTRTRYRRRNVVERCVNRLKQWRGIATRFEKRAANYRAVVIIASLIIWLP